MPPPPPGENRYPLYGYSHYEGDVPPRQDFWRSPHSGWGPQNRTLGVEILHGLRSARGGIYYTKSNPFKQVHYVDRHIIYICQLVPPRFIPSDELNCLNTEVDKGLVRGEALDLLGYSYIETDAGKLSISGDLELVSKKRPFRSGPGSLADFCTNRVKLKSLFIFPIKASIGS